MGTELIGDVWLARLADQEGRPGVAARALLRTQILTYNRAKHLIAFNDQLPRRRIQAAVARGGVPRVYTRCLRCGCTATIQEWIRAASLLSAGRGEVAAAKAAADPYAKIDYLLPCPATHNLAHLKALTHEPAKEDQP